MIPDLFTGRWKPFCQAAIVLTAALVPAHTTETDKRIIAAAYGSHNFKTHLKDDKIDVAARHGAVTLTGTVQDSFRRALAEATVAGLPGVKSVNNQLNVREEPGGMTPDAILRGKVQAALLLHRSLSLARTSVQVENGVVILRGEADSRAQLDLATEYVKGLDGVARVENQMTVGADSHRRRKEIRRKIDDASITAQVKMALLFNKATSALRTSVRTEGGVVTLTGTARSKEEKDLVGRVARNIQGIRKVQNLVQVLPG